MAAIPTPNSAPDMKGVNPGWIRGISRSYKDLRWSSLDQIITSLLVKFNGTNVGTSNYVPLPFLLVKAMCWTETGATIEQAGKVVDNPAWARYPMQIGSNAHDLGLADIMEDRKAQAQKLLPPEYRATGKTPLTKHNVRHGQIWNIVAGIDYLLLLAAYFKYESVREPGASAASHTVASGESFDFYRVHRHTTLTQLVQDNQDLVQSVDPPKKLGDDIVVHLYKPLQIGKTVNITKASMQWQVESWKTIDEKFVADNYNQGDPFYLKKLTYCEWLINGGVPK